MDNKPTQKSTILIYQKVESGDIHLDESGLSKNDANLATKLFLNIVSILGLARTGKSTLLNSVVEDDVFETSPSMEGCTKGVWLSNIVEDIGENGATLFMDTEGLGNDSVKNDTTMLTPVVVLSKVIILNVWGQILVQDLLNRLALFCHMADRITLQGSAFQFGHLIIVVRNYRLEGTEKEAYNLYFGEEKGNTDSVKRRNTIRKKLLSMFQSITVKLFPDAFKRERTPGNDAEINKDFTQRVNELREEIRGKVGEPHKFGGETCLKLDNISEFIETILSTLKEDLVVGLETIVSLLQRKEVDNASSDLKSQLLQKFDEVVLPATNLEETLVEIKDELIKKFDEKTSKVDFEKNYQKEVKNKLSEEFFVNRMNAKKTENEQLQKRENAMRQAERKSVDSAQSAVKKGLKEDFQKIDLPMTDDEEPLKVTKKWLKIFDEITECVNIESQYKNAARDKFSEFASTELEELTIRNEKAKGFPKRLLNAVKKVAKKVAKRLISDDHPKAQIVLTGILVLAALLPLCALAA